MKAIKDSKIIKSTYRNFSRDLDIHSWVSQIVHIEPLGLKIIFFYSFIKKEEVIDRIPSWQSWIRAMELM